MLPSGSVIGPPPFLLKLYEFVDDRKTDAVVSWDPGDNSFTVHRPTEFSNEILPKYFKHNNFSSFVRQLNQYGFHKVDPDKWSFSHELFMKNRKDLLSDITRKRAKNTPSVISAIGDQRPPEDQKAVVELGNYGIVGEMEVIRRDKELLLKELLITRQQESKLKQRCESAEKRIEDLEHNMKQMQQFIFHFYSRILSSYPGGSAKSRKRLTFPSDSTTLDVSGSENEIQSPTFVDALGNHAHDSDDVNSGYQGILSPNLPSFPPAVVQELNQANLPIDVSLPGSSTSRPSPSYRRRTKRLKQSESDDINKESSPSEIVINPQDTNSNSVKPETEEDNRADGQFWPLVEYTPTNPYDLSHVNEEDLLDFAGAENEVQNDDFELPYTDEDYTPNENSLELFSPLTAIPAGTDMDALIRHIQSFEDV